MKIRLGDTVVIISGKDKGKTGTVERVIKGGGQLIVSGINMRTRHIKKTPQQAGRKVRYEASINTSKVMIVDPKTKKPSRIGFILKDGKKMRVSKASGSEIAKAAKTAAKKPVAKAKTDDTKKEKKQAEEAATEAVHSGQGKQPFWKRMKFGSAAMEQAEVGETPKMEKDQSIPDQQVHRRGGRGS